METNPGAAPVSDLPSGVTQTGGGNPQAAPVVQAQPIQEASPDEQVMEEGGQVNSWKGSGLQILAGVLICTLTIFAVAYYRTRTLVVDDEIKNHDAKIRNLATDVEKIKSSTAA